jgi:hypothetical protein
MVKAEGWDCVLDPPGDATDKGASPLVLVMGFVLGTVVAAPTGATPRFAVLGTELAVAVEVVAVAGGAWETVIGETTVRVGEAILGNGTTAAYTTSNCSSSSSSSSSTPGHTTIPERMHSC